MRYSEDATLTSSVREILLYVSNVVHNLHGKPLTLLTQPQTHGTAIMVCALLDDQPLAHEVFQGLVTLNKRGVTILLVEQNVHMTLEITTRAYVMEHGRVVMDGPSRELSQNEHVRKAYLGL